jgi:lysophospholipase L1-like esterase
MNKVIFTITSMLLALGAEAALQHRYIFNESVMDVKGDHDAKPSKLGAYTEVPLYVDDVPAGAIKGAPLQSMKLGMQDGKKKSGFSLPKVLSNPGSLSLWIKSEALVRDRYVLFAVASGLSIGQNDEGLVFGIGTGKNKRVVQATMATGTWVHLAATWDVNKNEAAIYVDGKLAGAINDLSEDAEMVSGARVGNYDNMRDTNTQLKNQFVGNLYDFQVYNHSLTATEVAQLHAHPGSPSLSAKVLAKAKPIVYPWQNYKGPLQQNWFDIRDGLKNSQSIFETTKKGTVAFVGGSITGMDWRNKVQDNLEKRFPDTKFKFILAGVGSTGTMYGAYRLDRDVIQKGKADLIFEEAAVNDLAVKRTADQSIRGMEGIVRNARRANPNVDIVMMHFACPEKLEDYKSGKTPGVIASFDKVAEQYGVPTLDLTREIFERIERGEFTWEKDIVGLHPSPFGQQLYADGIERLLDEAWAGAATPVKPHPMPAKVDEASYDEGQLFPPQSAVNCNGFKIDTAYDAKADGGKIRTGWNEMPQLVGTKPGDSFELKFKGSAVAMMVIAGPKAGIVEHSVDGSDWVKQDLFTKHSPNLHLQRIYMLRDGLDPETEHLLKVRIANERNELSVGNNCRVVYFGINGDPRKVENMSVDDIYFEGSDGHGPEK